MSTAAGRLRQRSDASIIRTEPPPSSSGISGSQHLSQTSQKQSSSLASRSTAVESTPNPPSSTSMRSSAGFSTIPTSVGANGLNSSFHNDDPFEKPDRHQGYGHYSPRPRPSAIMSEVRARMGSNGQRTRLIKALALIGVVSFLFFFLAPGNSSGRVKEYMPKLGNTKGGNDIKAPISGGSGPGTGKGTKEVKPVVVDKPSTSSKGMTTSKCTKPYSKDKPLIQYALMIDAGSTGSRIHVYRFNNCGETPELEDEIFEQTAKKEGGSGLSSYKGDPQAAAESLDVLLAVAVKNVPEQLKSCTPIAVKATAGLRKLGEKASEEMLAAVRKRLETKYPFPVVSEEENGVVVMDGVDEAVYAWVTVNYLLGKIGSSEELPTAAVLDLGGGSTQIVFEPKYDDGSSLAEGEHRHELSFGGRDFVLYQHSYLGYGLMEERNNVHRAVLDGLSESTTSRSKQKALLKKPIANPCLNPGTSRDVEVELGDDHPLGETINVTMTGPDVDSSSSALNAASCRGVVERTLKLDEPCTTKPCSFAGVHQPTFPRVFPYANDVVLLSYFFDRMSPLGMPGTFSVGELKALSQRVCSGPGVGSEDVDEDEKVGNGWADFAAIKGAMEELQDRPETCLDLSYMVTLLRTGYGMKIDRELRILKQIDGNELGWCLGASLPLLSKGSGWECKIKQTS